MTTGIARAVRLATVCADCNRWPCACSRPDDLMPDFALRIERCVCGSAIAAGGAAATVRRAVEAHNATPAHAAWRAAGEAPIAL